MKDKTHSSEEPPKLSEFDSLERAIEAKIKHYKQIAEKLAEDR
jgi:hypothetical protein